MTKRFLFETKRFVERDDLARCASTASSRP
jgi:hypothetical protein